MYGIDDKKRLYRADMVLTVLAKEPENVLCVFYRLVESCNWFELELIRACSLVSSVLTTDRPYAECGHWSCHGYLPPAQFVSSLTLSDTGNS